MDNSLALLPSIPSTNAGYIHALFFNKKHLLAPYEKSPAVLQILRLRLVTKHNVYIGDLSDGLYYITARFDTRLNSTLSNLDSCPYVQAQCSIVSSDNRRIAVVKDITVLHYGNGCNALEEPVKVATADPEENTEERHREVVARLAEHRVTAEREYLHAEQAKQIALSMKTDTGPSLCNVDPETIEYVPLAQLSVGMTYFTICVMVETVSVRDWKNARGSGQIFTAVGVDASGYKIKMSSFEVAAFESTFQKGLTYAISGGKLAAANPAYLVDSRVSIELRLDKSTRAFVVPAHSTCAIKRDFGTIVTAHQVARELAPGVSVTFFGYLAQVGEITAIESKKTGKRFEKIEFIMVDADFNGVEVSVLGDLVKLIPQDDANASNSVIGRAFVLQDFKVDLYAGHAKLSGGFTGQIIGEEELELMAESHPSVHALLHDNGNCAARCARISDVKFARGGYLVDTSDDIEDRSFSRYDEIAIPASVRELNDKAMGLASAAKIDESVLNVIYKVRCCVVSQQYRPSQSNESGWPWFDACLLCNRKVSGDPISGYVCSACGHTMSSETPPNLVFCWNVTVKDHAASTASSTLSSSTSQSSGDVMDLTLYDKPAGRLTLVSARRIRESVVDLEIHEQQRRVEEGLEMIVGRSVVVYVRLARPSNDTGVFNTDDRGFGATATQFRCLDAYHDHGDPTDAMHQ